MRRYWQFDNRYPLATRERNATIGRSGVNVNTIGDGADRYQAAPQPLSLVAANHNESKIR